MKMLGRVVLSSLLFTVSAFGQTEADLARVLLPVTVRDSPGAGGALWDTESRISIAPSAQQKSIVPLLARSACDPPCSEIFVLPADMRSIAIDFYRTHAGETSGSYMYIDPTIIDDVHLSLVVRDLHSSAPGAELPVVRDRDFANRALQILNVPISSHSRVTLRVYGDSPDASGSVQVRAYEEDGENALLLTLSAPLIVTQRLYFTSTGALRARPPVAEMTLTGFPPTVRSVRLEVTPNAPSLRIWAFATITDNVTNAVVTRTPR